MAERYSGSRAAPPTVDPAQRKFAAKRWNEMVKEAACYVRGFPLGILLFGFVRVALNDAMSGTSGTTTVSVVASLAIQSMTICMIRAFYRRED